MSWTWRASNSARLYNESRSATISPWSRGLPLDCGIGRAGACASVVDVVQDLLEVFPGFAFGFLVVLAEQVGGAAIPLFGYAGWRGLSAEQPYWQLLNLNPMIRVVQLALLELLVYSWVYQNVQSSAGSTCMVL